MNDHNSKRYARRNRGGTWHHSAADRPRSGGSSNDITIDRTAQPTEEGAPPSRLARPRTREGARRWMAERSPNLAPSAPREKGQAQVLAQEQMQRVIDYIRENSNSPCSDEVKVLLSFYAGLRAGEIASLSMDDVCNPEGNIGSCVTVRAANSKNRRARSIPMHKDLKNALMRLKAAHPNVPFIAFSHYGNVKQQNAMAVCLWFLRLYATVGLHGCSSHSGRRTFITTLARSANRHNKSLRDVQLLAGHARLDTTERYIDPSEDLSGLIASLGSSEP